MRKRKYDAELIIIIVKGHIEEGLSSRQLSVQYNIHHGIIEEWISSGASPKKYLYAISA